jgi:tRNA pseudouridine38-40 synthase
MPHPVTRNNAVGRVKVVISYDGSNFLGWQVQKSGRTVEGEVCAALGRMHKEEVSVLAAGRTDSGVHASGQVISFQSTLDYLDEDRICRALNNFFPKDVRARRVQKVADSFHPRYDARERVYKYYILPSELPLQWALPYSLRVVHKPSLERLNRFAACILGTHDFTGFSAPNDQVPDRVRTVYSATFAIEGPFIVFWITASSFLWKMVRSLTGSILEFEKNGMQVAEFAERLAAADRTLAGPTAPALGLFLHKVVYKDEALLF